MSQLNTRVVRLGASADPTKNFLISVPAVPDGTLTIERESGTDVLTIAANGQIQFPVGFQSGTYTPTIIGLTSAGAGTYSTQVGDWQRIGKLCIFRAYLVWTAHTGTGNIAVTLPFTAQGGNFASLAAWADSIILGANQIIVGLAEPTQQHASLRTVQAGGGSAGNVAMDTAGSIIISGAFPIA